MNKDNTEKLEGIEKLVNDCSFRPIDVAVICAHRLHPYVQYLLYQFSYHYINNLGRKWHNGKAEWRNEDIAKKAFELMGDDGRLYWNNYDDIIKEELSNE